MQQMHLCFLYYMHTHTHTRPRARTHTRTRSTRASRAVDALQLPLAQPARASCPSPRVALPAATANLRPDLRGRSPRGRAGRGAPRRQPAAVAGGALLQVPIQVRQQRGGRGRSSPVRRPPPAAAAASAAAAAVRRRCAEGRGAVELEHGGRRQGAQRRRGAARGPARRREGRAGAAGVLVAPEVDRAGAEEVVRRARKILPHVRRRLVRGDPHAQPRHAARGGAPGPFGRCPLSESSQPQLRCGSAVRPRQLRLQPELAGAKRCRRPGCRRRAAELEQAERDGVGRC